MVQIGCLHCAWLSLLGSTSLLFFSFAIRIFRVQTSDPFCSFTRNRSIKFGFYFFGFYFRPFFFVYCKVAQWSAKTDRYHWRSSFFTIWISVAFLEKEREIVLKKKRRKVYWLCKGENGMKAIWMNFFSAAEIMIYWASFVTLFNCWENNVYKEKTVEHDFVMGNFLLLKWLF